MKSFKVSETYCKVKLHIVDQFIASGKILYSCLCSSHADLSWMLEAGYINEDEYESYMSKLSHLEVIV